MRKTYIVAVSGGIDSVSLLHKLMSVKPDSVDYVVAHVDHGVREDSTKDAEFVKNLAKNYDTAFETKRLELGKNASEETARDERYKFLFTVMKKYKAEGIITAHHQDDVLETMILNILRGTSPRGLAGFSRENIIRPFINKTKKEILDYARDNNLDWREDSTNLDTNYLRNKIRLQIMPKIDKQSRQKLLLIRDKIVEIYTEIDNLTKKLIVQSLSKGQLVRSNFVVLPYTVQKEFLATWLRLEKITFDKKLLGLATNAIKTFNPGKKFSLNKHAVLSMGKNTIILHKD